jgi:hypothetical protein
MHIIFICICAYFLLQAPEDLVCPITRAVFRSPVVTTVGTVYEEIAISQHLKTCSTDPLTNQTITDKRLTPVFLVRSRSRQYASETARACIDKVLEKNCDCPARFLRRACDLCDEAGEIIDMSRVLVVDTLLRASQEWDDFTRLHTLFSCTNAFVQPDLLGPP